MSSNKSWKWIDTYEKMRKKGYTPKEAKNMADYSTKIKRKPKQQQVVGFPFMGFR